MASESTATQADTTEATASDSSTRDAQTNEAQTTGDATGTNSGQLRRGTFTQADLDRIIKDRLDKERSKSEQAQAKAKADAEAQALAEQGKYKEIADKLQADLQAAQAAVKANEIKMLQMKVAGETKLPAAFAELLKGDNADEMTAHAQALLAAMPKPAAPDVNASNGAGGAPGAGQLDEARKAEIAAAYGVNPKLM